MSNKFLSDEIRHYGIILSAKDLGESFEDTVDYLIEKFDLPRDEAVKKVSEFWFLSRKEAVEKFDYYVEICGIS